MGSFFRLRVTVAFCVLSLTCVLAQRYFEEMPAEVKSVIDGSQFGGPIEQNQFGFPTFGGAGGGQEFSNGLRGGLDGNPNDPLHGFMFQDFSTAADLPIPSSPGRLSSLSMRATTSPILTFVVDQTAELDPSLSAWVIGGQTQSPVDSIVPATEGRSDPNLMSRGNTTPAASLATSSQSTELTYSIAPPSLPGSVNDELNAWLGSGMHSTQTRSPSDKVDRVGRPYDVSVPITTASFGMSQNVATSTSGVEEDLSAWINSGRVITDNVGRHESSNAPSQYTSSPWFEVNQQMQDWSRNNPIVVGLPYGSV